VHQYQDLITIFNRCFASEYNTQLAKGSDEPIYLPANEERPCHTIFFAHGFFSSALHECSHWLIAGEHRRKLVDFGYWYAPDGRTAAQQALFQSVEIQPQAMEWVLSQATKHRFRVSIDNLNGEESDTQAFKQSVYQQVKKYCEQGLSTRANLFRKALCSFYSTDPNLHIKHFDIEML
jgi:elongation factor P hydroxylase